MTTDQLVMVIEKPSITVKLHERTLEIDVTEGLRKDLEDIVEARPALRQTLGFLFQTIIPLDVPLKDIESVTTDQTGRVEIVIPHRKDLVVQLKPDESKVFVDKLNGLVAREWARVEKESQERRRRWQERAPTLLLDRDAQSK